MQTGFNWGIVLDVGVGVGVLLVGISALVAMRALAQLFSRLQRTLDQVDLQLKNLATPVAETLSHVGGIAESADRTVVKLSTLADALESIAVAVTKTVNLVQRAVAPSIANVGATLTGISAGLRRIVRGSQPPDFQQGEPDAK